MLIDIVHISWMFRLRAFDRPVRSGQIDFIAFAGEITLEGIHRPAHLYGLDDIFPVVIVSGLLALLFSLPDGPRRRLAGILNNGEPSFLAETVGNIHHPDALAFAVVIFFSVFETDGVEAEMIM